jgi:hypothetical protein
MAGMPDTSMVCGVGAHPSPHVQLFQKEGPTMDEMFKQVQCPLLFCPGWSDPSSLRDDGYYMQILKSQPKSKGSKSILFKHQLHGFANRADLKVPQNKRDCELLMNETLAYFKQYLEPAQTGSHQSNL